MNYVRWRYFYKFLKLIIVNFRTCRIIMVLTAYLVSRVTQSRVFATWIPDVTRECNQGMLLAKIYTINNHYLNYRRVYLNFNSLSFLVWSENQTETDRFNIHRKLKDGWFWRYYINFFNILFRDLPPIASS